MRAMKDSGVEWIGEIPEEWNVVQARRYVSVNHGSNPETPGIVPVYGSGSFSFKTCGEYKEGPTVLLGRKGTLNVPQYITGKYWNVDTAFDVAITEGMVLRYYYYLAVCFDYMYYCSQTAVPSMTQSNYLSMRLPIPNIDVQNHIVSFLDTKCAEIDKVVEQTRATIEEYKKLKQAIITEAVTKGVRGPRPMKPSGVEWIGDIPEEWRVGRIKDFAQLQTGSTPSTSCPHYFNGDIPWFTPGDFSESFEVNKSQRTLSKQAEDEKQAVILPPQTPLIVGIGASAGKVSFSQVKCSCNQQVTALVDCSANRKLLTYILEAGRLYLRDTAAFTTLPIINNQTLGYFKIAVPVCNTEQQEIVAYLDTKCAEIDRIIGKKERLIEELGSYKKSLIYEYVTGKKQVLYK